MTTSISATPRWATKRTPSRPTFGPQVDALTQKYLGRALMPWQRQVADVALEIDPETNLPVYRTVVLTVPRQSGKSTLLLSLVLHRVLSDFWSSTGRPGDRGGRQRALYAAQTAKDARSKWKEDYLADIEASRALQGKFRVSLANGSESIHFKNGSSFGITASTEKAAHGKILDLPLVDEAFSLVDDRLDQAFVPAMSTRRQAQQWVVSTAGTPESLYLKAKVDRGRALVEKETTSGIAFFEWSAEDDVDIDDEDMWRRVMPALGHTIDISVVRAARETLSESEFRRAYLNLWVDRHMGERVFPDTAWVDAVDTDSAATGAVVLGIDVALDRSFAAVSAAGWRSDGAAHLQILNYRPGTDWIVEAIEDHMRAHRVETVVIDPAGPAGSLIPDLLAHNIPHLVTNYRQMAQACGGLYDALVQGRVKHLNEDPLDLAVQGARKRDLGDAWAYGKKHSASDISPLVSVTLAHWGLVKTLSEGSNYDAQDSLLIDEGVLEQLRREGLL